VSSNFSYNVKCKQVLLQCKQVLLQCKQVLLQCKQVLLQCKQLITLNQTLFQYKHKILFQCKRTYYNVITFLHILT
jgi:hypothetical protein